MSIVGWIVVILVAVIAALVLYGYIAKSGRIGVHQKSLWDWLSLLIVPVSLAVATLVFTAQQNERLLEIEDQRAQDDTLQAYLDKMSELILSDKDGGIYNPEKQPGEYGHPEAVRLQMLARSRTKAALTTVDGDKKRVIIVFLYENELINRSDSLVSMTGAPLYNADLHDTNFVEINLEGANLGSADFSGAIIPKAIFSGTDLRDADFKGAFLPGADFSSVNPAHSAMYLKGADLTDANFTGANLTAANLTNADLTRANLTDADLTGAFVNPKGGGPQLITQETLEQQTDLLEGTTMPDGTTHP